MPRQPLDRERFKLRPLTESDASLVEAFSCADPDLDDFIRTDAFRYQSHRLAQTYLGFVDDRTVGFMTLAADAIKLTSNERKKLKNTSGEGLRHNDHPVVPAIKLARLGACREYKQDVRGVDEHLVRIACLIVASTADTVGCRLLTVDAYPLAIEFYEKLGFVRNGDKSLKEQTHPSMRLDVFNEKVAAWLDG